MRERMARLGGSILIHGDPAGPRWSRPCRSTIRRRCPTAEPATPHDSLAAVLIRPVLPADHAAIGAILEPVIRAGETFALDRDLSRAGAWRSGSPTRRSSPSSTTPSSALITCAATRRRRRACLQLRLHGGGARQRARRRAAMAAHSFDQRARHGYRAMQFNFVVSTNERAVRLWQALGFAIVAVCRAGSTIRGSGYVDSLIMHREL
jgi:hypothetical protein